MNSARTYARGPVPVDIALKKIPAQSLIDALISRSVAIAGDDDHRLLARDDERPLIHKPLALRYSAPHPEASKDRTVVRFVVSSGEDARDDKDLHIEGIDFSGYDLNPVWLFAHDWEGLPIGRCLARRTFQRGNTYELWKDIEFTPEDLYPFGHQVGQMHARGFLRACSGGWMGTRIRVVRGKDGRPERIIYLDSDWMETSSCAVGIDKYALQEAVRRNVLKPDGVEQFARAARIAATGIAYEIAGERAALALTADDLASTRAIKPHEKRKLVEEHIMQNTISDWDDSAVATRAVTGGDPGDIEDEDDGNTAVEGDEQPVTSPSDDPHIADPPGETPVVDPPVAPALDPVVPEGDPDAPAEVPFDAPDEETDEPESDDAPTPEEEGEGEPEPEEDDGDEPSSDPTMRAALALLRRARTLPALRGPVSQAVDSAVDSLFANVMVLANCAEEMRHCASGIYYEGRSAEDVREALAQATERVMRQMVANPSTFDPSSMDAFMERCVSRAESALSRSGNALAEVRDAVALFTDDATEDDPALRAGRKISRARRTKLSTALSAVRSAMEQLQEVLDEEPDEEPDENEDEDEKAAEDKGVIDPQDDDDAKVAGTARALVARADALLATRSENSGAVAPLEADRLVALSARAEAAMRGGGTATPSTAVPPATALDLNASIARRARALAARGRRFQVAGVRLPSNART